MSDFYEKNLAVLQAHHPHVIPEMSKPLPFKLSVTGTHVGMPNLFWHDQTGQRLPVYPESDPLTGLAAFLDTLGELKGKIIAVLGFGLGYYAAAICEKYGRDNIIVVFEAFPQVIQAAMTAMDLRVLTGHPNVRMVVGDPGSLKTVLTSEKDVIFGFARPKIVDFKRWTRLAQPWYQAAREHIERFSVAVKAMNVTMQESGRHLFFNRFRNLSALKDSFPLRSLSGKYAGVPAVIVAAGPSLSNNIHRLKDFQEQAVMIAADSAAAPLLKNGIVPHFIAAMDIYDYTYEKIALIQDQLTPCSLLFVPEVNPLTLKYAPFKATYYTYLGTHYQQIYNELLESNAESLGSAQSVVHLAISSALQMGCNPIILMGLDLSFQNGKDHADETILNWGNQQPEQTDVVVEGVHGEMLPTAPGLLNILDNCEQMISQAPDTVFIDATEGGAKVKGTRIMPAAEALAGYCKGTRVASPEVDEQRLPMPHFLKNLKQLNRDTLKRKRWVDEHQALTEKIDAYLSGHPKDACLPERFSPEVRRWLRDAEKLHDRCDRDLIVQSLSDVLGVSNEGYIAHESRRLTAMSTGGPGEMFTAGYEKQKFVQQARRTALSDMLEQIKLQIRAVESVAPLEKAVKDNPRCVDSRVALAAALYEQEALSQARRELEKLPGEDALVRFYQGAMKINQGKVQEGKLLVESAVGQNPLLRHQAESVYATVEQRWLDKRGVPHIRHLVRKRLMALGPSQRVMTEAWLEDQADIEKKLLADNVSPADLQAVKLVLSDWEPVNDRLPNWHIQKARCLILNEGLPAAISYITGIIRRVLPRDADLQTFLARLLIQSERFDEGFQWLRSAVGINPQSARLWEEIGDLLVEGDPADALLAYENCLNMLPENVALLAKIGDCYAHMGSFPAARVAYQSLLQKMPENEHAKARLKEMDDLSAGGRS